MNAELETLWEQAVEATEIAFRAIEANDLPEDDFQQAWTALSATKNTLDAVRTQMYAAEQEYAFEGAPTAFERGEGRVL